MIMRRGLLLLWKNGLAYLFSLLTASLFFPLLLMLVERDSTYGWWFMLILFGSGMRSVLIPELLIIVLFNVLVFRAGRTFAGVGRRVLLGVGLSGVFFLGKDLMNFNGDWEIMLLNTVLMTSSGGLFGFYHYRLTRADRSLIAR